MRLVRDSATGQGRGFGLAAFGDDTGVPKAPRLACTDFGGRPLRVTETMDVKRGDWATSHIHADSEICPDAPALVKKLATWPGIATVLKRITAGWSKAQSHTVTELL